MQKTKKRKKKKINPFVVVYLNRELFFKIEKLQEREMDTEQVKQSKVK